MLDIKNLILNYHPTDIDERICKKRMIEVLDSCNNCFSRDCKFGHFTASAFLLNKEMTHVLLMHHTKLDKWMQLGGHCDGDSDVKNVSIKEAQEESGINNIKPLSNDIFDIDMHLIPANKNDEAHYHFDVRFLLHAYDGDDFNKNHESKELRWVHKNSNNIPTNSYSVIRMFEKLRKM